MTLTHCIDGRCSLSNHWRHFSLQSLHSRNARYLATSRKARSEQKAHCSTASSADICPPNRGGGLRSSLANPALSRGLVTISPTYTAHISTPNFTTLRSVTSTGSYRGIRSLSWHGQKSLSPRPIRFQFRPLSRSIRAMATKIDGTSIAKKIRERLHGEILEKQKLNPRYQPCLKIIQGTQCPGRGLHVWRDVIY
jgi:hypothetical protein